MSVKSDRFYKLGCAVLVWLIKGMCIGFGMFAVWRVCRHAP